MNPLDRVSEARGMRGAATVVFEAAIKDAVAAGESKSAVARAAGISRPTLYKLLKNESE